MIPGIDFPLWYIPVGIWAIGWILLTVTVLMVLDLIGKGTK